MAVLKVSQRKEIGTRKVRLLREQGMIPAIIYGHRQTPVAIALNEHDIALVLQHGERVLELDVDGKKENVLIKEAQYDTFGHKLLHVDLSRVRLDERVEVTVPIVLRGTPAGARDGGVLQQTVPEVTIECLVTAIPEDLRVNVNELNIGDFFQAKNLELPQGATLQTDPDMVICTVSVIAEEEEVAEAEEVAEPEVIGEKPEEGEAEATEGQGG